MNLRNRWRIVYHSDSLIKNVYTSDRLFKTFFFFFNLMTNSLHKSIILLYIGTTWREACLMKQKRETVFEFNNLND